MCVSSVWNKLIVFKKKKVNVYILRILPHVFVVNCNFLFCGSAIATFIFTFISLIVVWRKMFVHILGRFYGWELWLIVQFM